MSNIKISNRCLMELSKVLDLLKQLNSQSGIIPNDEIQQAIVELKKFLETPDFEISFSLKNLTKQELIEYMRDLYFFLSDQSFEIKDVCQLLIKYIHKLQPKIVIENELVPIAVAYSTEIEKSISLILGITTNYIIIDTDIHIVLLDKKNFTIVKTISIDFINSLYHHYINAAEDKLMFYYGDKTPFLLFVDLNTQEQKIIPLNNVGTGILSPFYLWYNNKCIIATLDEVYWEVDVQQGTIQIIQMLPKQISSYFRKLFLLNNKYCPNKIDAISHYMVFGDTTSDIYKVILIKNSELIETPINIRPPHPTIKSYYDFDYKNGIFIAVSEYEIQLSNSDNILAILRPEVPYRFYRAKILNNKNKIQIAILIGSDFWQKYSSLLVFEIDDNMINN